MSNARIEKSNHYENIKAMRALLIFLKTSDLMFRNRIINLELICHGTFLNHFKIQRFFQDNLLSDI